MDDISTASLCRAVLPDAHHHSGGKIVNRNRDTPHSQLRQPGWAVKKTNEFLQQAHIHPRPSRSFSVLLVLTTRYFTLQINSLPTYHPGLHGAPGFLHGCLPTTLQTRKLMESRLCPVSHRTANTVPWQTTLTMVGLTGLSSLAPTPHRWFTPPSFITLRIHLRVPSFSDSSCGPCYR